MSSVYTYPGVYIQELPSPVHSIAGVATSITAFVGYTARGIDNRAQAIYSFADFQRLYGGLASNSEVSYAVQQFYLNGGSQAYVVRTPMHYNSGAVVYAEAGFGAPKAPATSGLAFAALSSGQWANGKILIDVDVQGLNLSAAPAGDPLSFNLTITNLADGTTEYFPDVTLNSAAQNFVQAVVNDPDNGSQLVNVTTALPTPTPTALVVTGVLGTGLASTTVSGVSYLETVNAILGGGNTTTTASADCSLTLTLPASVAGPMVIKIIGKGAPIPQTVAGLATQMQQAINNALATSVHGASVTCSAAPNGANTFGIRVNALLPNLPDATISFSAPTGTPTPNDASHALGLTSPTSSNVAHYALGTGNTHPATEYTSTAATAPAGLPYSADLIGDPSAFTGIYALNKVPIFNLLSIPEAARAQAGNPTTLDPNINPVEIYSSAIVLCDSARAMLLIDPPPNVSTVSGAVDWKSNTIASLNNNNSIAFFPRLRLADALNNGQLRTFAPSGLVAGVYANSDGANGVWTAPAGISAVLNGVQNMTYQLSDAENGVLNPLGLNCFRTFPIYGPVLWGARTTVGADALASQWKYVPVRRMALFLESSLYQGTQWVVFQPNADPLWAAIRLNVGAFMQTLFLKGAFQGQTPDQAYFVKCDGETTTQTDIDNGVVNILVGFAPLKPAEFVVIQIEQLTGQPA
ncbi:MAG TPA: phage tail sheath C-terminal domain-containing protein [Terracidiphilus sp.]|nr:phage tail sheath C-terminal domain-containing protein [Terracidiphilus sp.]